MSLVLILRVFRVRRVYRGSFFFSLVLILCIPAYLRIKRDRLRKIECNKFVCNEFVLVLVQIDLIQFESSNCIRSICTKTDTNSLHTNSIHSILRKNRTISRKIGHVIQIVVHQFVRKTTTDKNSSLKKIGPPLSPGMLEYVESVLRRKKLIP
jgi:hypothetical protein